jgi:hypothetical protein
MAMATLTQKAPRMKKQLIAGYCKITYFRWDFISCFCHIVVLLPGFQKGRDIKSS